MHTRAGYDALRPLVGAIRLTLYGEVYGGKAVLRPLVGAMRTTVHHVRYKHRDCCDPS